MSENTILALMTDRDGNVIDPSMVSQRTFKSYPSQFWGAHEAARQENHAMAQVGIEVARYVQAAGYIG